MFLGQEKPDPESRWIARANPGAGSQSQIPRKRPWKERDKKNEGLIQSHEFSNIGERGQRSGRRSPASAKDSHQKENRKECIWTD